MTKWIFKTALEQAAGLASGEVTSVALVEESLERIRDLNPTLNAFLTVDEDGALATAREADRLRAEGKEVHLLAGVPIAIKDNIVTRGLETTCASKILEGWKPPYDATVVARIKDAHMPIIGKTNLDEFAMGSSTEHSAYGPTRNPWDPELIPGGSGGGSAAAVASYMVPLALGTDTGGSIRQPAAFTGTVGVKPTYGAVSRYGAVPLASSLEQVGPVARDVQDAAALQDLIAGHDPLDATSLQDDKHDLEAAIAKRLEEGGKGLTVAVPAELLEQGFEPEVAANFNYALEQLQAAGAKVISVETPSFEYALPAYYLLMPAEASSNLARFDGIRFGQRVVPDMENPTAADVMRASREAGFGAEVKRRIILGTHVLSAGFYDQYYGAAQKVRTLVREEFAKVFEQADVLLTPTTPSTAFPLGARIDDPLAMYLNDVATIPANLAGVPALSLPDGVDDAGLPTGLQVVAPARKDDVMYGVAALIQSLVADKVKNCPEVVSVVEGDAK